MCTRALLVLLSLAATNGVSAAADAPGVVVSASVAAAEDGGPGHHLSLGASAGYRFNRVFGLEVELTSMRLSGVAPADVATSTTTISTIAVKSDGVFYTTNIRIEIPTTTTRIVPFAVAGGGVFSLHERSTESIRITSPVPTGLPPVVRVERLESRDFSSYTTALGFTLGGGVSFVVGDHLSLDADLRAFYVRGDPGGSIGRFGGGVTYRF